MRRSLTLCLLLAALLGLAACGSTGLSDDAAEVTQSRLAGYEQPPQLTVVSGGTGIPVTAGSFSWNIINADGTGTGTEACGVSPVDMIPDLTPIAVREEETQLYLWFEVQPDEIEVQYLQIVNGTASPDDFTGAELSDDGYLTAAADGDYLYEVHAVWDSSDGIGGDAYYTFSTTVPGEDYYAPLPAYVYPGDDPQVAAIVDEMLGEGTVREEGSVTIPAFCIFLSEANDDGTVSVYGNFWTMSYHREGTTLVSDAGGENPGVFTLRENADGSYTVTEFDRVGDGNQYTEDIARICEGHPGLKEQYLSSNGSGEDAMSSNRMAYIIDYVNANNLAITAYQDFGWEPVPLSGAENRAAAESAE